MLKVYHNIIIKERITEKSKFLNLKLRLCLPFHRCKMFKKLLLFPVKMNFTRTLPSKVVRISHWKDEISKKRSTNYNPVSQNHRSQGHNIMDRLVGPGRFKAYQEYPLPVNDLNESYGRKRARDFSDDDHSDAKRPLTMVHYESKRNSFPEGGRTKRPREFYDDDYDDDREAKKRLLNDKSVQYAIKQPSQYTDPNRKILEYLFDPEITAEGWKKKTDGIEYHTEVCGKSFYEIGHSVVDARENVAATALKKLCNFKRENIFWPELLLPFQLNQDFADKMERSVY